MKTGPYNGNIMMTKNKNQPTDNPIGVENVACDLITPLYAQLRRSRQDPVKVKSIIGQLLAGFNPNRKYFPLMENTYSRTILCSVENQLEIMVARWDKNTLSSIHGHPGFVFEYLIDGRLMIENYERNRGNLIKTSVITQQPGEYFCDQGIEGRFDNAIHRIIAVEQSLSLHVYSDQGLKGLVFQNEAVMPEVEVV